MAKTKFTQGEWVIGNTPQQHNASMVCTEDGKGICSVYELPVHASLAEIKTYPRFEQGLANAHLIASAPDLYAALEELTDIFQGLLDGEPNVYDSFTLQPANLALRKARGEA